MDSSNISNPGKQSSMSISILGRTAQICSFDDYIDVWCAPSWKAAFLEARKELAYVWSRISSEPFVPNINDVFRAFDLTPLTHVKVVILAQDPYPGEGQACGLAFSVRKGQKIPDSLRNIFNEISAEYPGFTAPHGDLTSWTQQGVLLLNSTLTMRPGKSNSHAGFYNGFIEIILSHILKVNPKCVFLIWGRDAEKAIGENGPHATKLISTHPSPQSFADSRRGMSFKGNGHFLKANLVLRQLGGPQNEIIWTQF